MKLRLSCFAVAVWLQLAGSVHSADAVQVYGDWSVFSDEVSCWIASHPYSNQLARPIEDIYFFISFDDKVPVPQISVLKYSTVLDDVEIIISEKAFKMGVEGDTAYATEETQEELFRQILSEGAVKIFGLTENEPVRLSTEGLRDAYNAVSKECNFKTYRRLSSDGRTPA